MMPFRTSHTRLHRLHMSIHTRLAHIVYAIYIYIYFSRNEPVAGVERVHEAGVWRALFPMPLVILRISLD